ncbi:MAG: hypothetical protein ACXWQQ_02530 [Pseudobdellovibrio sp.]
MKKVSLLLTALIITSAHYAFAWGGRGHNTICESAVFLVKNPELREFLKTRPHVMGHLCNIPDIYWKSLPSEVRKSGDPGHYINSEKLGIKLEDMPTDFKKIIEDYQGKPSKENANQTLFSIPDDLGSVWWRGDQFFRLALESAKKISSATAPANFKEAQDNEMPYNKAVYQMMVNMGIMGHFVGDISQPFHNTSDHDGWAANHGGIHSYYEDAVVSQLDGDLQARIIKQAQALKNPKFVQQKTTVEAMRALSVVSFSEVKDVLKADQVLKPSSVTIDKGMSLKKAAERKPASETYKKFEKLIVGQMARSSLLLAHLWDQIYEEAGKPDIKAYGSFLYPFTPDFVKPDYFDVKDPAPATK